MLIVQILTTIRLLRFELLASLAIILFIQFLPFYEYLRIIKEFLN